MRPDSFSVSSLRATTDQCLRSDLGFDLDDKVILSCLGIGISGSQLDIFQHVVCDEKSDRLRQLR